MLPTYVNKLSHGADVDKSIGDDIDDFYNRIKTNKMICLQYSKLDRTTLPLRALTNEISPLYPSNDSVFTVRTFHVSMLTEKEESHIKKIYSEGTNDTRRGRIELFKNETDPIQKLNDPPEYVTTAAK